MKLLALIIGLALVSFLFVGAIQLMSQSLKVAGTTNTALKNVNDTLSKNVTIELEDRLDTLSNKTNKLKKEMNTNTDLISTLQIMPSLLDMFLDLSSFLVAIPNGIGNAISYAFPQVPQWAFAMVTLMVVAIVVIKILFAVRGSQEV